jgi:hypothetical protein
MCSPNVAVAIFMREHGIKPEDLEGLPKPLRGLPAGAVQRLSASGVIQHASELSTLKRSGRKVARRGVVYQDRARRIVWGQGSQYSAVMDYLRATP